MIRSSILRHARLHYTYAPHINNNVVKVPYYLTHRLYSNRKFSTVPSSSDQQTNQSNNSSKDLPNVSFSFKIKMQCQPSFEEIQNNYLTMNSLHEQKVNSSLPEFNNKFYDSIKNANALELKFLLDKNQCQEVLSDGITYANLWIDNEKKI